MCPCGILPISLIVSAGLSSASGERWRAQLSRIPLSPQYWDATLPGIGKSDESKGMGF